MSYDNSLRGALFVNNDKRSDNHPDYKGSIELEDGEEYWVSAWIKTAKSGKTAGKQFLSLALTPKDDNASSGKQVNRAPASSQGSDFLAQNQANINRIREQAARGNPPPEDDFSDDIPF
jgi:hypothetical protein